jgi:hypothetical protein
MEEASMGGSLPPPLALAASARNHQAQGSDAASLDDLFAIALSRLMEDGITPDMAIQGFMEASTAAMQRYRCVTQGRRPGRVCGHAWPGQAARHCL